MGLKARERINKQHSAFSWYTIYRASEYLPVENSPGDLSGVPLQIMTLLGLRRQELVGLAVNLDQGPAMTWIDFVPGESTQFNLHFNFCNRSKSN